VPIGTALFAATTAFQLVKEGCALYKEVKGVAGNVQQIYNEINGQFAGKKVSKAQAAKIEEEKQRVQKVAAADPDMVMFKISDDLGNMFDQIDKIEALFWEQERDLIQPTGQSRLAEHLAPCLCHRVHLQCYIPQTCLRMAGKLQPPLP